MAILPSCKPNGECVDVFGADYEACKANAEAAGLCPGLPEWLNLQCISAEIQCGALDVSCCDRFYEECIPDTPMSLCWDADPLFHPMCPNGCSEQQIEDCIDWLSEVHACCVGPVCSLATESDCIGLGGSFLPDIDTCENNPCDVGCRFPDEPHWNPGDKRHTLDLCVTAAVCLTKPPATHLLPPTITLQPPPPPGRYLPITVHEVRAVEPFVSDEDPCRRQYGVIAKGPDGRRYALVCSSPASNDPGRRAYNQAHLCKARGLDPDEIVPKGRYYWRVGLPTPVHREVQYGNAATRCEIIE